MGRHNTQVEPDLPWRQRRAAGSENLKPRNFSSLATSTLCLPLSPLATSLSNHPSCNPLYLPLLREKAPG